MGRRKSKNIKNTSELKSEIAALRLALAKAETLREPTPEEMEAIDAEFKETLRMMLRHEVNETREAKRKALLEMADFAP